jgi:Spy/CpxP family protein refolding chaperone
MRLALLLAAAIPLAAMPALAQNQHQHHSGPGPSSYAGQHAREIKALSPEEIRDLQAGAGMGFAKAAELNRYPGPLHVLENGRRLELSDAQTQAMAALLTRHKERARALGERVVQLERELDGLFASGKPDAMSVDRLTASIAETTGKLRAEHLKTHLEAAAMLSPAQVARYAEIRGYVGTPAER